MLYYLKAFFVGIRVKTLPVSQVPILMASAWAFHKKGFIDLKLVAYILLSAGAIQCTVNLLNDAIDFKKGIDKKERKGSPRLTERGILSYKQVLFLGGFCGCLAFLAGIPLIIKGGWPILAIGICSLLLCYLYSGSSFALVNKAGVSDLFVILFFGIIAVGGTYYLHTSEWEDSLSLLGLQCGLWALSILLINYLRDEKEDRESFRDNFIIRYGREFGILELSCAQAFIYLLSFYWMDLNIIGGFFTFLLVPLSIFCVYKICITKPSSKYNSFLFSMSLLYVAFGFLWILGFIIK